MSKKAKITFSQVGTPDLGAQYHSDVLYVGLTWLAPGIRFLLVKFSTDVRFQFSSVCAKNCVEAWSQVLCSSTQ